MVEAAEISSLTGDLPSMGHENPDPITSMRSEKPLDTLSSEPKRVTGLRRAIAGATTFAAIATGAGGITPPSADAAGIQMTAGGEGNICLDPKVQAYFRDNPELAAKSDPEALTTTGESSLIAQAHTSEGALVSVEFPKTIPVPITMENGQEIIINIVPCPPESNVGGEEDEWPYETVWEAQQAWIHKDIKIDREKRQSIDGHPQPFNTPMTYRNPKENPYLDYVGVFLGVETIGDQKIIILGHEDKKKNHYTAAYRISSDENSYAELIENEQMYSANLGLNPTDAERVANKLKDYEGNTMIITSLGFYFGPGLGLKTDNALLDQFPASDKYFKFAWDASNTKSYKSLKIPKNVNKPANEIKTEDLPIVLYLYKKPTPQNH